MNEYEKILWGFGAAVGAILVGWILNQGSEWFSVRHADKRNLKQILYTMFETHYLFLRIDVRPLLDKVSQKIYSLVPGNEVTPELKGSIDEVFNKIISGFVEPDLLEDFKKLQSRYEDSIKLLSTIDPLMAYYLGGKINVVQAFTKMESAFEHLKAVIPVPPAEMKAMTESFLAKLKPDIVGEQTRELEEEMTKIAWKINPWIWHKAKKSLRRINRNMTKEMDERVDKLFNMMPPFPSAQQQTPSRQT